MATKRLNLEVNQRGARKAQSQMQALGGAVTRTIAGYVSFGLVLSRVGKTLGEATEKYKIQQAAEKTLEQAIGGVNKGLLNQASALQKTTSFADEEIIKAQALIASFVKEEDAIKAATRATLDLAAAKGMDLVAAADLVSKTLGSSTNALSRYGIAVQGAVGSQERLNDLVSNIERVFGGQAAAQMETLAGKAEDLDNSWGDLLETIGETADIVDNELGILQGTARAIDARNIALQTNIDRLRGVRDVQGELKPLMDRYRAALERLNEEEALQIILMQGSWEEKTKAAEALVKQAQAAEKAAQAYQEFKQKQLEKIATTQQEAEWMRMLNEELLRQAGIFDVSLEKVEAQSIAIENLNKELELTTMSVREHADSWADSVTDDIINKYQQVGVFLFNSFTMPLIEGKNAAKAFGDAMIGEIKRIAAELAARAALFLLLTPFMGTSAAKSISFAGFLPGKATGGPVQAGQPQILGERGPEIFIPNENGRVLPTGQTRQLINNNNSEKHINVTVNVSGNVMQRDFIQDNVIPEIQRAIETGQAELN